LLASLKVLQPLVNTFVCRTAVSCLSLIKS
jgi:hypothetical protein